MSMPRTSWYERDTTPGLLLVAATLVSFALLNGPSAAYIHALLDEPAATMFVVTSGDVIEFSLHFLINDGLMAIFFLFVGLELKRETVEGPFKNPREAALPIVAAAGGMIAPALIYLAIAGGEYARGWAIPAATDIAFAVGVLSLLGARVPPGLRLFLLALAIIDDLGAILVIAFFYSTHIVGWALGGALIAFLALLGLNRVGVTRLSLYWLIGAIMWAFMLLSGVHATIAGVLTALAVPMRDKAGHSPLIAAEHALKNWVQLGIMPIFALANAGVTLGGAGLSMLAHPVTLGIGLGLLFGKPLGITLAAFAAAALMRRALPASPMAMFGLSIVAGIGFTMSLFIGGLAFGDGDLATPVRFGVLGGSLLSALIGLLTLALALRGQAHAADAALARDEDTAEREGLLEDIDPNDEPGSRS